MKKRDDTSMEQTKKKDVKNHGNKKPKEVPLNPDGTPKSKAQLKAERRAVQEAQRASKLSQQQDTKPKKKADSTVQNIKQKPTNEAGSIQRVAYNVQMDDTKAQKKISKKLAKQQVPLRNLTQKKLHLFSHLHQYEKNIALTKDISLTPGGPIHPAIVKLGLQYAEGIISGSNARCLALLYALKQFINDYTVPPSKELSRDLETKMKPCISFLSQCRQISVSMGNAIKFVKHQITSTPHDQPESEAKALLLDSIDQFIDERILLAGDAISGFALKKIKDGDTLLIYGFSALIVRVIRDAHACGKRFRVVVVDSRPDFPGRESVQRLATCGVQCSYVLINAISYVMKEITSVFLGAHALLANGSVLARAGSAMVAMVAKSNNVPVLACCETYKFCERVQTDAFVYNELGDPDLLVQLNRPSVPDILHDWRQNDALYLLNLVYDVTPAHFVDVVITDIGMIPCTSVPVGLRVKNTETERIKT